MLIKKFFAKDKPLFLFGTFWISAMLALVIGVSLIGTSTLAGWWLAVGSAWFLLLSLVLGAGVVSFIRRRRVVMKKMKLLDYLKNRDMYITTQIYVEFVNDLNDSGISDEEFSKRLTNAFEKASEEWHGLEPDDRSKAIKKTFV